MMADPVAPDQSLAIHRFMGACALVKHIQFGVSLLHGKAPLPAIRQQFCRDMHTSEDAGSGWTCLGCSSAER